MAKNELDFPLLSEVTLRVQFIDTCSMIRQKSLHSRMNSVFVQASMFGKRLRIKGQSFTLILNNRS